MKYAHSRLKISATQSTANTSRSYGLAVDGQGRTGISSGRRRKQTERKQKSPRNKQYCRDVRSMKKNKLKAGSECMKARGTQVSGTSKQTMREGHYRDPRETQPGAAKTEPRVVRKAGGHLPAKRLNWFNV